MKPLDDINKDVSGTTLLLMTTSVYPVDCACLFSLTEDTASLSIGSKVNTEEISLYFILIEGEFCYPFHHKIYTTLRKLVRGTKFAFSAMTSYTSYLVHVYIAT